MAWLFSYGSNSKAQLKTRLGRTVKVYGAFCDGVARIFVGHSQKWNGAVASLENRKGNTVYGSACNLNEEDFKVLDTFEGVAAGKYKRVKKTITIAADDKHDFKVEAICYISTSSVTGAPSKEYLSAVASNVGEFWTNDDGSKVTAKDFSVRTSNPTENPVAIGDTVVITDDTYHQSDNGFIGKVVKVDQNRFFIADSEFNEDPWEYGDLDHESMSLFVDHGGWVFQEEFTKVCEGPRRGNPPIKGLPTRSELIKLQNEAKKAKLKKSWQELEEEARETEEINGLLREIGSTSKKNRSLNPTKEDSPFTKKVNRDGTTTYLLKK